MSGAIGQPLPSAVGLATSPPPDRLKDWMVRHDAGLMTLLPPVLRTGLIGGGTGG